MLTVRHRPPTTRRGFGQRTSTEHIDRLALCILAGGDGHLKSGRSSVHSRPHPGGVGLPPVVLARERVSAGRSAVRSRRLSAGGESVRGLLGVEVEAFLGWGFEVFVDAVGDLALETADGFFAGFAPGEVFLVVAVSFGTGPGDLGECGGVQVPVRVGGYRPG